ncbi:hypothetical protein [Ralstonia solanacearum]|uniref:hypothetical protein n=1 Tax=Ralstonia solanacearum TaxID=305 RepID=UPI0009BBFA92|nr:hypothetical protein [Ralstonia solanacearum]MCL9826654.1 hypothetical protein [Ralstonia solanacearum]MCL9831396.1 hypothetical protein [Ralstonia solanacearum]MCL9836177.1 hypothetical protein [Ralstonia solanacearum]
MHAINQIPPDRMTPEQRRRELASLLANGIARLRLADGLQSADSAEDSEVLLGFHGNQSVHSDTVNNTKTES